MKRPLRLAAALCALTLGSATPSLAEGLKVVASFSIIGDFAKNVGGARVTVTTLVGPDGDAHVYEPKPADARAMAEADVILVNGLNFEGFLKRLTESSETKAPVVELAKGVETLKMDEGHDHGPEEAAHEGEHKHDHEAEGHDHAGHDHGDIDPHAFQDVTNAKVYVKNVADAFCQADAAGCDGYHANAETYLEKLDTLEAEIRTAVEAIPADKRTIITSHDAFGYFARAYGLTFLAPEGVSTEAEASAADVAALIRQVRADKASAIFVENITNKALIEQIAAETGLKVGGTLFSDALSAADGAAPTYVDLMRHNILTIRGAILGS